MSKPSVSESHTPSPLKRDVASLPPFFSVDETDEFHDPFSDLNLFLAKKIKQAIIENGSPSAWSTKIQNDLLKSIMPEFKNKFPNYRLGLYALKKTFEKTRFYYDKLSDQIDALLPDGRVNTPLLIRENLKTALKQIDKGGELFPESDAHKLALRISECIATLEGEHPPIAELTSDLYASLKYLQPQQSPSHTLSPFEPYTPLDKLVVKTVVEVGEMATQKALMERTTEVLTHLKEIPSPSKSDRCHVIISTLLAKALKGAWQIDLPSQEIESLEAYVKVQRGKGEKSLDIVNRLSTLFALSHKSRIRTIDELNMKLMRKVDERQTLDDLIFIQSLKHLQTLTKLEAEIIFWAVVGPTALKKTPRAWVEIIESEVIALLLRSKRWDFKAMVNQVTQFLKQAKETLLSEEKDLKRKIARWTAQGELIFSHLTFDPKTPLLALLMHNQSPPAKRAVAQFIALNPLFAPFEQTLQRQAKIYKMYLWYTVNSKPFESPFDRFIKRHHKQDLESLCRERLPLMPFCPKYAKKQINA